MGKKSKGRGRGGKGRGRGSNAEKNPGNVHEGGGKCQKDTAARPGGLQDKSMTATQPQPNTAPECTPPTVVPQSPACMESTASKVDEMPQSTGPEKHRNPPSQATDVRQRSGQRQSAMQPNDGQQQSVASKVDEMPRSKGPQKHGTPPSQVTGVRQRSGQRQTAMQPNDDQQQSVASKVDQMPQKHGQQKDVSSPAQASGSSQRSATSSKKIVVASSLSEEKPHLKQQIQTLPRRPGYGTEGKKIRLKANFFKLDFKGVDFLYHYDIEIKPDKTPVPEARLVVEAVIDKYLRDYFENHRPAFDGKRNLYSRKKLPSVNGNGCDLDVTLIDEPSGKEKKFNLTIKYAAEVRVEDLHAFLEKKGKAAPTAVQALDIILRQIPSLHFTSVGRSFFPSGLGSSLGGGCEVKTGFYQTVRPSQWKTMLVNIDVSSKGFITAQPVLDLLCEICGCNYPPYTMKQWQKNEFLNAIKGFKVETNHIPEKKRKYLVTGLGKSAVEHEFTVNDDNQASKPKKTNVKDYFKDTYNIELKYPNLPCLVVGQKKNHLPMEVCHVVESQKRKLTDDQIAEMIKKVTKPAYKRKKEIENWADELHRNSANYLQDQFNMSIDKNMVDVEGRVLPAPDVTLGNKSTVKPRDGVWDMRGKRFHDGVRIDTWALVCLLDYRSCGENVTKKFSEDMSRICCTQGINMNPRPFSVNYSTFNEIEKTLIDLSRVNDIQLFIVVLPQKDNKEMYKKIKHVTDIVLGIPSQCIKPKQFKDAKPQVCSNLAMKINAKLGGTNHIIDNPSMPPLFSESIVFGADVTHPSPGESNIPSLAAVVASIDAFASKYAARVRAQTHIKDKAVQEIILDMKDMVRELLIEFWRATGKKKPKRIIFYRDGVSEGQFDQVLAHEVRAVQEACTSLEKDYQPTITFIVVQKRHHARLFCADKDDESGKARNVPPGTIVDRGITHPYEFDFYLVSHQGIQGTSRPTHYHVLYDDNSFDADSMEKLTYHLCHTYARCTRSVSMPASAYYAHLVAFRARQHLNGLVLNTQGKADKQLLEEFQQAIKVNDKLKTAMYFA